MSKISEQLRKYASEEKQAHETYIKDFSAATIAHLVRGGVEREKAAALTKEACLRNEDLTRSINKSLILEKTAAYIESIEEENVKLAAKISTEAHVEKKAEMPSHLQKLANIGFTAEEIEALSEVPTGVLEKVASTASEPWSMGKGVGPAVANTDPLLNWILS